MPLCPYCGNENRDGAAFCHSCRRTIAPQEWLRPRTSVPPGAGYPHAEPYRQPALILAGFWPRAGAWILDTLFVLLLAVVPIAVLAGAAAYAVSSSQDEPRTVFEENDQEDEVLLAAIIGGVAGYYAVFLAYFTIANGRGGGWGKRIVGLRIIRQRDGHVPEYGTGFLRTITPVLFGLASVIPFAGNFVQLLNYLWCIWDGQKQCWHDKVSGTLVIVAQ